MFIGKESDGDSMVSCWDPGYAGWDWFDTLCV